MDETLRYISKINRNMELYKRKKMKNNELNATDSLALHLIRKNQGISQDGLVKLLGVDKGLVTKIVQGLEEKGLIKREKNLEDKRMNFLYSTPKAEEIKNSVVEIERKYFKMLFEEFSKEEYEVFLTLLTRIYTKSKELKRSEEHEEV